MTNSKIQIIKKSLFVAAALTVGFLMPYLSRIPLALTYGTAWIWKYMPDFEAVKWWNYMHLFSLAPIFVFGLVYVFGNVRWTFYIAALAHFAATFLCYWNFEEHPHPDDFLGFIVFPYFIGFVAFVCGIIALAAELFITNRKMKSRIKKEFVYE